MFLFSFYMLNSYFFGSIIPRLVTRNDSSAVGAALRIVTSFIAAFWAAFVGPYICLCVSRSACAANHSFFSEWIVLRDPKDKHRKNSAGEHPESSGGSKSNGKSNEMNGIGKPATAPANVV